MYYNRQLLQRQQMQCLPNQVHVRGSVLLKPTSSRPRSLDIRDPCLFEPETEFSLNNGPTFSQDSFPLEFEPGHLQTSSLTYPQNAFPLESKPGRIQTSSPTYPHDSSHLEFEPGHFPTSGLTYHQGSFQLESEPGFSQMNGFTHPHYVSRPNEHAQFDPPPPSSQNSSHELYLSAQSQAEYQYSSEPWAISPPIQYTAAATLAANAQNEPGQYSLQASHHQDAVYQQNGPGQIHSQLYYQQAVNQQNEFDRNHSQPSCVQEATFQQNGSAQHSRPSFSQEASFQQHGLGQHSIFFFPQDVRFQQDDSCSETFEPEDPQDVYAKQPSRCRYAIADPVFSEHLGLRNFNDFISLEIVQQPNNAKAYDEDKEKRRRLKSRKPDSKNKLDRPAIDPPPVVQLTLNEHDPENHYLQNPCIFLKCELLYPDKQPVATPLSGSSVSSIHRLKKDPRDKNEKFGGYFIFEDISVQNAGTFMLKFNLFELRAGHVEYIKSCFSEVFTVQDSKSYVGKNASTSLTKAFSEQGAKVPLRKEPRARLRKDGPSSNDYVPRMRSDLE